MNKELDEEIKKHIFWLVSHLAKKGFPLKDVNDTLKKHVSDAVGEEITDMTVNKGLTNSFVAKDTGYSIGHISILTSNCIERNLRINGFYEKKTNEKYNQDEKRTNDGKGLCNIQGLQ